MKAISFDLNSFHRLVVHFRFSRFDNVDSFLLKVSELLLFSCIIARGNN